MEQDAYHEMYVQEDVHWWFRGRRSVIWALLRSVELPTAPRFLDAGCGTGRNLVELATLGRGAGVDPAQEAVEYCRARGLEDVRQASLDALPFESDQFDLVLACDVLEHVCDDIGALRELRRVSATGGTLLVTVPAYPWLWTDHDDALHHLRRYTVSSLLAPIRAAGWTPVRATYFNSLLLPLVVLARLAERVVRRSPSTGSERPGKTDLARTPPALNDVLAIPMQVEAELIRRGTRFPAGVSLGTVCRNPG